MRTKIILIVAASILALVLAATAAVLLGNRGEKETPNPEVTFPAATSTTTQGGVITIGGENGMTVNDFIHNGVTIEDPANEGSYYLAGETGYCNDDGTCVSTGEDAGYNIVYYAQDNSFVIALTREPLGEVRRDAEQYLLRALGVSAQTLCTLRIYVGTSLYVSEVYGDRGNLGISFCPNATTLPL